MATTVVNPGDGAAASSAIDTGSNGAAQTDEQILGITEDSAAVETPETQPETQATEQPTETTQAQTTGQLDTSVLKELFKDAKYGRAVQSVYDKATKYAEAFPTVQEAFEYRNTFPSLEDAKAAAQSHMEQQQADAQIASGDPAQYASLIRNLSEWNPDAAKSFARNLGDVIREVMPDVAQEIDLSTAERFLSNWAQQAQQKGLTDLSDATGKIYEALFGRKLGDEPKERRISPEAQKALDENKRLREENAKNQQTQVANDKASAEKRLEEAGVPLIRGLVDKALEKAGADQWAKDRLVADIAAETSKVLTENEFLQQQIQSAYQKAGGGQKAVEAVANLLIGRAKQAIPAIAAKAIESYTKARMGTQKTRNSRQENAAQRTDIQGGAAPGTKPSRPLSPKDIDYSKMNDDAILGMK